MKLTTLTMVTVDGVMQGLGAPDEDRRGGFERGGWVTRAFDDQAMDFLSDVYQRADAFLFGRWTYEVFAGSWGTQEDMRAHPVGQALNSKPKYVASNTLTEPTWSGSTVLSGDLLPAVQELKAKPGGELQVHGGRTLIRWLLENELVDEITLVSVPVIVGQGERLFPESGLDFALELVDSRITPRGVIVQVYRPTGRPEYVVASEES